MIHARGLLKSIEAQHGLFVERARGIYSFSHLTFHEYFTARQIVAKCTPSSIDDLTLSELANHITSKRWRETLLLTVEMILEADTLLILIKREIDALLQEDSELQKVPNWVVSKSKSVKGSCYGDAAARAFFFAHRLCFIRYSSVLSFEDVQNTMQARANIALVKLVHQKMCNFAVKLNENLESFEIQVQSTLEDLMLELRLVKNVSGSEKVAEENYWWWQQNGKIFINRAKNVVKQCFYIDSTWHFSEEQEELLQEYYDANKLLIDCLNLPDIYVNRDVREEIESTLLLPIAEIQKRQNA